MKFKDHFSTPVPMTDDFGDRYLLVDGSMPREQAAIALGEERGVPCNPDLLTEQWTKFGYYTLDEEVQSGWHFGNYTAKSVGAKRVWCWHFNAPPEVAKGGCRWITHRLSRRASG